MLMLMWVFLVFAVICSFYFQKYDKRLFGWRFLFYIPWLIVVTLIWCGGCRENKVWQKYQQDLIPMPSELHEFGKIPLLDELDMQTWMTAPMIVMYDKEFKVKSVQTYIYDKDGDVRGYYSTFNKGIFKKGYMYGCDDWGEPIRPWREND